MHPLLETLNRRGLNPKGEIPNGLEINHATEVSGQCRPGSLFIAIKGAKADGHAFIADAASRGAVAALVEHTPDSPPAGLALIQVDSTRNAAGPAAQTIYGEPSRKLELVGVTGTNGKTTTAYLMEALFKADGRSPGLVSTVVNRWAGKEVVSDETTPSGPALARRFAEMVADGVDCAAMEVSSHAIDQRRVDGLRFRAMALTNVTQDHLDYHKSMDEYAGVKMSIFRRMHEDNPDAIGVINADDPTGKEIIQFLKPEHRLSYAIRAKDADLAVETILFHDHGMRLTLNFRGERFEVSSPLHCYFNAMNILTATGLALAIGMPRFAIMRGIESFRGAPGRFEMINDMPGVRVIVDYAHTPDAVMQVLLNARGFARHRLIAVIGCGGDRDPGKRPKMGKAAAELAHELIVTNDNPRTEDPVKIADAIIEGIKSVENLKARYTVILDRREAIRAAIDMAEEGDAIVVAGKGHEDYQILGKEKIHFDDREEIRAAIDQRLHDSRRAQEKTVKIAIPQKEA